MDLKIKGKNALITGGGKGIGKEIVLTLAKEGVNTFVISRTKNELESVCNFARELGVKSDYKVFDLNKDNFSELKSKIENSFGNIDILVNNAAKISIPKKITYMEESDWNKTINIDLNSTFKLIRLFIEDMKKNNWGRVIMIGSLSGSFGASSYPAYCTVKAGLEGLMKNLAVDYSKYGITTNMVSPGFTETERFKKAAPKPLIDKFKAATSVKRLGKPEDIANTVAFLASTQAEFITGVNIPVCGGLNLGNFW